MRVDVFYNHKDVIGFLYIHEGILSKAFLVKRLTDFLSSQRTVIAVSVSCFEYNPFRMYDKQVLGDVLLFSTYKMDKIFPSKEIGDFLVQDIN